jgi:hypothetical protein
MRLQSNSSASRLLKSQWVLKPQDLAVAFKLLGLDAKWTYAVLAKAVYLSPFEAHAAVQRLGAAGLATLIDGTLHIIKPNFKNFVLHGAIYAYPSVRTEVTIGFPTAYAAAPLKGDMPYTNDMPPVWPHAEGTVRGVGLLPLYPKLPLAAIEDPALYEKLALFDALRMGQARERKLVAELLAERLA